MTRRDFLTLTSSAVLLGTSSLKAATKGRILFGACRGFGDTKLMKAVGYDFVECGVGGTLIPDRDEEAWKRAKESILKLALPIRSCNGFLPGSFRLTGPNAAFEAPLKYAEKACRRADEVGIKTIVFGSGGARNAPEGFPKAEAEQQFLAFCKQLAARITDCKVTVVLEPLQPKEANYLNFVREGIKICHAVQSPRIRQLADLYHMMQGGEDAQAIDEAGDLLMHCHIAEKNGRGAPGLKGDGSEFVPYFAALKRIGYCGGVSCECGWGSHKDFQKNLENALAIMRKIYEKA